MLFHRFVDRQQPITVVFVSGFGFIHDFFASDFESEFVNVLWCTPFFPLEFETHFTALLDRYGIRKFIYIGFSLGGFLRCSPRPLARILVGVGCPYLEKDIDPLIAFALDNKHDMLKGFYRACFLDDADYALFQQKFESQCLEQWSLESVISCLEYLKRAHVNSLPDVPTLFIHGRQDAIMPLVNAQKLSRRLNIPLSVYDHRGHVFLDFFKHQPSFLTELELFLKSISDTI